ncbi:MATE family efflux transporter [Coriobacteriales bacterium OH1046]|nr:MATE family efflux transporter [Coriobacteriales bacterium OH1046]
MARIQPDRSLDVTEGVIWRQLLQLAVPVFLSAFFQQAYAIGDALVVGRFGTENSLGGIQATTGLVDLALGFAMGIGAGATIICGQFFGSGDHGRLRDSVHTGIAFSLLAGILIAALSAILCEPLLRALGTPAELLDEALVYARVYSSGMVFSIVYNMGASVLRAVGDTRTPSIIVAVCCAINIALDLAFVAGLGMGAAGAALATALSFFLAASLVIRALVRSEGPWRLEAGRLGIDGHLCWLIIKTGVPLGIQTSAYSLSNIILQSTINSFGADAVTAWGIATRLNFSLAMLVESFAVSVAAFCAQNFGARRYDRMRRGLMVGLALCIVPMTGISVAMMIFSLPLASLFTPIQAVSGLAAHMFCQVTPYYGIYCATQLISGAIRGSGESLRPMLINLSGTCGLRLLWLLLFVPAHHTIDFALLCYPLAWIATTIVFALYYRFGHWLAHGEDHRAEALA